jgi:hypothetical protein
MTLRQLGARAWALKRTAGAGRNRGDSPVGHDASEMVEVAVDARAAVRDVYVHRAWSTRLDAASLGDALRDAYVQASSDLLVSALRATEDADAASTEERDDSSSPSGESPVGRTGGSADPPGFEDDNFPLSGAPRQPVELFGARIERIESGFDQLARIKARSDGNFEAGEVVVSGRHGFIEVTVRDRHIAAVTVDQQRVSSAPVQLISEEALSAFKAAQAHQRR